MLHHELVRSSLHRWDGHEFSESGDGLLAWFETVPPAVEAAVEIQRRTRTAAGRGVTLRLREGLAAGPTLMRAGRPYGLVLNRAARLVDIAGPDEIVVDPTVARDLPPRFRIASAGQRELRGIGTETISVLAC
jgi:class 3 adenylate cyclase